MDGNNEDAPARWAKKAAELTEREKRITYALALMAQQYLETNGYMEHMCMSAGEEATAVLFDLGLLDTDMAWSLAGKELLGHDRKHRR